MAVLHLGIVVILSLVDVGSSFEFRPVFYAKECPNVPPSANFNESQVLNLWFATQYTNPSFSGYQCVVGKVTKIPLGLQYDVQLHKPNGQVETFSNKLTRTQTPGVYKADYKLPGMENAVSATQVFILNDGKVLIWTCVDIPMIMMHFETANVISRTSVTPDVTVNSFKQYLKTHGSSLDDFYQTPNVNCRL